MAKLCFQSGKTLVQVTKRWGKGRKKLWRGVTHKMAATATLCYRSPDLLMKMGRFPEAREEIERAIDMTQNLREQELLTERLKQIMKAAPSGAVQS